MRISTVRLDGRHHRVVRPVSPPRFAGLGETRYGIQLCLDQEGAETLATAWGLAARSPHTIVHLPLRDAAVRHTGCAEGPLLDLVLLHHRLGFPASRWRQVRSRLGPGAAHTVTLPDGALPDRPAADHRRVRHQEFRDHLRWDVAADTLVLTGSREAYELAAERIRDLVEQGPALRARDPQAHSCAVIPVGRHWRHQDRRRPYSELHVQYCG